MWDRNRFRFGAFQLDLDFRGMGAKMLEQPGNSPCGAKFMTLVKLRRRARVSKRPHTVNTAQKTDAEQATSAGAPCCRTV